MPHQKTLIEFILKTPNDLSIVVQEELGRRGLTSPPQLLHMLETMYLASLATEEGVPTRVQVAYANPAIASDAPQGSLMHEISESLQVGNDRWRCVPLLKRPIFSPTTVVKLAAGTDPRSSVLLAYEFEGQIEIWGLADMQDEFALFSTHAAPPDKKPDRPGHFQVHIEGVGHLIVFIGFERIAELRGGKLLPPPVDVLAGGPVLAALKPMIDEIYSGLCQPKLSKLVSNDAVEQVFLSAIYQLLIRAENFRHGGAFLIAPSSSDKHLHITNKLQYTRLLEGIASKLMADATAAAMTIFNLRLFETGQNLPVHLWAEQHRRMIQAKEAKRILDGAIWFTALLTRIDGLVLLDHSLVVRGFGVVVDKTDMPSGIGAFHATSADPTKSTVRPLHLEGFGTRHGSMAAYCARNPGSIGFVISKDGGVRAFMRVGKQLIMWDNITLHQAPSSQEEVQTGENVVREFLEEGQALDRERGKSEPPSSSNRSSKELERLVAREYTKLFRSSTKKKNKKPSL